MSDQRYATTLDEVMALRSEVASLRAKLESEREKTAELGRLLREATKLTRIVLTDETGNGHHITDTMVDRALNAWFASPPSETDQGLERSMRAALGAALSSAYRKGEE